MALTLSAPLLALSLLLPGCLLQLPIDTGPLDEGVALVLRTSREAAGGADWRTRDYDAAFWFKDDVVYAVNEDAQVLVPDLERAPESITLERVLAIAD